MGEVREREGGKVREREGEVREMGGRWEER